MTLSDHGLDDPRTGTDLTARTWYTPEQAATLLNEPTADVRERMDAPDAKTKQIHGDTWIRRETLAKWMNAEGIPV